MARCDSEANSGEVLISHFMCFVFLKRESMLEHCAVSALKLMIECIVKVFSLGWRSVRALHPPSPFYTYRAKLEILLLYIFHLQA